MRRVAGGLWALPRSLAEGCVPGGAGGSRLGLSGEAAAGPGGCPVGGHGSRAVPFKSKKGSQRAGGKKKVETSSWLN